VAWASVETLGKKSVCGEGRGKKRRRGRSSAPVGSYRLGEGKMPTLFSFHVNFVKG